MRIIVKARTNARKEAVELLETGCVSDTYSAAQQPAYCVYVKEAPVQGRANEAISKLLAEHFKVTRSSVRLIAGHTTKQKLFEITLPE